LSRFGRYDQAFNPVWHMMLYSCTRMATVSVKVLNSHARAC